ncbi:glycosyltransferase family 4 protein [Aeromicrobium fastidiosum]|uniref:Glycosyltransferase family 4 protein n=1 Tax=Aeromicrobium fastidiosum TaxID=52699 RepID=A0A641AUZ8_9ACTN|nr:glycosyltransferase family 1 protein [Aeromicrobium fastidiosum]KAA1380668.1 glycosyltransferase family 4 protein [Aeromicrobium fastidiosum]MBP2390278.1 glycosyltransferase involved in cell wall biosynthesis [Aeromicrobium fastidiosum]
MNRSPIPKVALSMLTLVPGGMGGSETYARELTRQLAGSDGADVTAFVPENVRDFSGGLLETQVPGITAGPSTKDRLRVAASATVRRSSLQRLFADSDVVHYPFTVPLPAPPRGTGFVQSLLDVQHLELPELFSRAELLYRRRFYQGGARRADRIITISEFARERMIDRLGIPPEKVVVAHLGVDVADYEPNAGAREHFVLYPARGWAHKNHARLVAAMEIVRRQLPDLRLVLTGGGLDDLGPLPDWVDRKGLVDLSELRELYRQASAMVFPSLYEGFGLPPLEAMASGCPVAASDAGSIPEVCGDAAVLFDALDVDSIAEGVVAAITRSDELYDLGLQQAARFTWESCRDVHLDVYRSLS